MGRKVCVIIGQLNNYFITDNFFAFWTPLFMAVY